MKIALIGYGKMGKEIEKVALERNHEIVLKIDIDNYNELTSDNLKNVDVAIEFTTPESAYDNIMACFDAQIPVVSGSTGWLNKFYQVKDFCEKNSQTFFYAANFSIGVNIFFKTNQFLAKIMNNFNDYNVEIEETHHTQKLDAPSGTAIRLADDILSNIDRKKEWELNTSDKINKINILAKRIGNVPGIHTVNYDSEIDSIHITHSAKSRKGFALGAVLAAEFIKDKKGIYSMNDLLNI
ncbi:MAG: 4-hydroxy-tetrahydrodipicolinate reductase [Bacteroidales bacterium]|nr:4-hydroxy-tetrahydrodipicolinate reductase [Bacteroidales bacterium]